MNYLRRKRRANKTCLYYHFKTRYDNDKQLLCINRNYRLYKKSFYITFAYGVYKQM
nr:MAG TPA: hypothetical protein [Caudoviricetes sp.]